MEDKTNAKKLICPIDIGIMKEALGSLNENVLTMTSNEIKRKTIKVLGFNCSLSDFENIVLDKTEKKVLKVNYEKAKQALSSHFSVSSRAKTIFIDEIEIIFKELYIKNTVACHRNKFDVKVEMLANRISCFLDHRFDLIAQSENPTYEFMLENVVIFAVLDGLAFDEGLQSLVETLQTEHKPITIVNDQVFIDLIYKKAGHPTNSYLDETAITARRWYPTSLGKAAITAFLKKKSLCVDVEKLSLSSIFKNVLSRFNKTTDIPITKTKNFFPAIFISGLRFRRTSMPHFLQHYATGNLYSASMPTESLLNLHNKVIRKYSIGNQEERENLNIRQSQSNETEYLNDHAVLDDIKKILRDEIDEEQSRQLTLTKLKQLRIKHDFNVQTEVFYEWILENLTSNKWSHSLGTGSRYLSAIGEVWIDTWRNNNIVEVGADDMDVLFEHMVEQRIDQDSTARDTLFLLFKFIASRYTIAIPESVSDNLNAWHVRSEFIPEHFYERLRVDLQSKYQSKNATLRLTIDVMLIFLRRGLFRPSELFKLQMRDIQSTEELWIYLRKNVFGRVKTFSATRKIPLGIFLKPDERKIVEYFLSIRKVETEKRPKALLFSQQANHDVIFDNKTFLPQITEFLSNYAGHRVVSYQFRHSGISNLQLVLFGDIETTAKYTRYSENQVLSIRRFFITHENDLCYQLSSVAGHLSPGTTLTTYSHFTDLILGQYLDGTGFAKSLTFWSNLSGISVTRLSNYLKRPNSLRDHVSNHEVSEFFDQQIKKYSQSVAQSVTPALPKNTTLDLTFRPSLVHCERILKQHDNAKSLDDISLTLTLPEQYVKAVIDAAMLIKKHPTYQTKRGQSRLVNSQSNSIRPTKMQTKAEDLDRLHICELLISSYEEKPKLTRQFIHHLLSRAAIDHSYISFDSIEFAGQFIQFFKHGIGKERWHISVQPAADFTGIEKWQHLKDKVRNMEVSEKTKRNKNLFPQGQAELYLLHPNATDIIDSRSKQPMTKYSTNALKIACHWIAIHLKSLQLYKKYQPSE